MTTRHLDEQLFSPPDPSDQILAGNALRSHGEFIVSLSELIDLIRTHDPEEPERIHDSFSFVPQFMNEELKVPASIKYYCDVKAQPDSIVLDITKETGEKSCASLEVHFGDKVLFISRDSATSDNSEQDVVLQLQEDGNDVAHRIDRVPQRDINALIAHLVTGRDQSTRPEMDTINVFSHESCESLRSNLPDIAQTWLHSADYTFENGRSLKWVTESLGREERLQTCRFTYETGTPGRQVLAYVDMQRGFSIEFATQERGEITPFLPDDGDMMRLQEVIQDLIQHYSDATSESDEGESIELDPNAVAVRLGGTAIILQGPHTLEETTHEPSRIDAQFLQDEA